MTISLNGAPHEVPAGTTLLDLVVGLGLHPGAVAVALNGEVVPRARHADTPVAPGDRVEVIRAVGGG